MKRIFFCSLIVIILMMFFPSCTMEKRIYFPGYNVEWSKSGESNCKNKAASPYIIGSSTNSISVYIADSNSSACYQSGNDLLASTGNTIPLSTAIYNTALPVIDIKTEISGVKIISKNIHKLADSCDIIILKSGVQIHAKVIEIGLSEIKYKKCSYLEGPVIVVSNADVYRIQYANGTEEIIPQNDTDDDYAKTSVKNIKSMRTEGLGEAGFFASILGLFIAGIPLGLLAFIFGIISLVKISTHPEKYKGQGFAFVAIILGLIDVLLVLILLSEM